MAGVSTATVSRTFSAPNLINAQTQERVLEAAKQLDYQPRRGRVSVPALNRRVGTAADAIGFQFFAAVPGDVLISNTFYAPVLAGAQAEASLLGMHLLLHTTDRRSMSQELPKMALDQAVGGMLLVGTADIGILTTFARHIPHIVLVDNRDETGAFESVISDGFGGAFASVQHLLALGHRRIGFFLSEPSVVTFQDRLRGYCCALWEAGIVPDPQIIVADVSMEQSSARLKALLESPHPPTALIAANDHCAFCAMRVCRDADVRIPDQLSIIGFDDITRSMYSDVPLSTIHVDKEAMGRLAVRRLYARMRQSGDTAAPIPCVCSQMPVTFVPRLSCCAAAE